MKRLGMDRPRAGATALLVLALVFPAMAAAQLVPKQLAGEPAEFEAMRAPDPVQAAIYSHSALLPVEALASKRGLAWNVDLPVEQGRLNFALLAAQDTAWQLELSGPAGQKMQTAQLSKAASNSHLGLEGAQVPARMYRLENLADGNWNVALTTFAKSSGPAFLLYEGNQDTELVSWATHSRQWVGERMGITAQLSTLDALGKARLGQDAGRIDRASLRVMRPDGMVETFPMRLSKSRENREQGIFEGRFVAAMPGDYSVQVLIQGKDAMGQQVVRTAEHLIPFVEPDLSLAAKSVRTVRSKRQGPERLEFQVPVVAPKNAGNYRAYAEVWGHDAAGKPQPVAWVGGMVTPESGALGLGLDERWIVKSGAQGPFELRNLRVEEAGSFVTIAEMDRLPVSVPRLRTRKSAGEIHIDQAMRMGPRPQGLSSTKAAGGRLLLVHGYCSGGVWPAGQFSNASTFLDANQNRSHDTFARLIGNYGANWNSFGIVAHSQGGAASLHLYTYYWSGLDNASAGRLIQSVGTPYQGTNLSGILATLGNWFGVGCGRNNNMTYSGASAWLAGIPSWARSQVNYYTTSFDTAWWRWDYCNAATDLVLSDPEDGTTEKAYGQLPGAINRGHTQGQCHTKGMRDPAQYLDASRNAVMNANAAR